MRITLDFNHWFRVHGLHVKRLKTETEPLKRTPIVCQGITTGEVSSRARNRSDSERLDAWMEGLMPFGLMPSSSEPDIDCQTSCPKEIEDEISE